MLLEIGEHAGKVAGTFDDRTCGSADRNTHFVADHIGERRLAQTGRSVQQNVIQRLAATACRGNRHLQIVSEPILAYVFVERPRTQSCFVLRVII